jgi:O-antigen/teichoic acid export membrane protein
VAKVTLTEEIPAITGNTRIIARNSFWYGLELALGILTAFATSIPVARVIGPEKLGYFNYVSWLTSLSGVIGGLGMAGATRKYMAEYLNRGQGGVARAIYFSTLRLQALLTCVVTGAGLILIFTASDAAYRGISAFLVLSLLPGMLVSIPAMANVAAENMRANAGATLLGYVVNIAAVVLSLTLGWDLLGIAIGIFAYRSVDCVIKLWMAHRWVKALPKQPLPAELHGKLVKFSSYNLILLLLNMVVWDRSDIIFLKALSPQMAQISFYTVAFNLTEKVQLLPTAVGAAMGASIQAQYGRDARRLPQVTSVALWYMFLFGLPLMTGMAVLSPQVIRLLYGNRYAPAIPVLVIAALFAIPRCITPAWNLLEAFEKQRFLALWMSGCGVANVVLDIWLIPKHGALGAAYANGLAQLLAVVGVVVRASFLCKVQLRLATAARAVLCAAAMAGTVIAISVLDWGWPLVPLEVVAGAAVFFLTLRLTGAFDSADRDRFLLLRSAIPARLQGLFHRSVVFLIPLPAQEAAR